MDSEKVIKFIDDFKKTAPAALEDTFLNGYCYWFAHILCSRFDGEIYYLPIENHFIAYIGASFYDITGEIKPNEKPYKWTLYTSIEPFQSYRITRDCINKE